MSDELIAYTSKDGTKVIVKTDAGGSIVSAKAAKDFADHLRQVANAITEDDDE